MTTETTGCPFHHKAMRPDLQDLPEKLRGLAIDPATGYPIPWFVAVVDGKADFRVADGDKWRFAAVGNRCWVCGGRLGAHKAFVAGPMCGINRTSAEPPSHLECATWSAMNCPFLNGRQSKRRQDEEVNDKTIVTHAAGIAILRNPGVTMVWVTKTFHIFRTRGGPLIEMGEPERILWYSRGRIATRAEVEHSIATGLPSLEKLAALDDGGMEELQRRHEWMKTVLPAAEVAAP